MALNLDAQFRSVSGESKIQKRSYDRPFGGEPATKDDTSSSPKPYVSDKYFLANCRKLCRNLNKRLHKNGKHSKKVPLSLEDVFENVVLFRHIVAQKLREREKSPESVRGKSAEDLRSMLETLISTDVDSSGVKTPDKSKGEVNVQENVRRTLPTSRRSPPTRKTTSSAKKSPIDFSPGSTMDIALKATILSQIRRFMLTRAFSNNHGATFRGLTDSSTREHNGRGDRAQRQHRMRRLEKVFEKMDEHCRGRLGDRELRRLFSIFMCDEEECASRVQVRALRFVVDVDADGRVTKEDFVNFMYREVTASRLHIKSFNELIAYLMQPPKRVRGWTGGDRTSPPAGLERSMRHFEGFITKAGGETKTILNGAPFPDSVVDETGRAPVILLCNPRREGVSNARRQLDVEGRGERSRDDETLRQQQQHSSLLVANKGAWAASFVRDMQRRDTQIASRSVVVRVRPSRSESTISGDKNSGIITVAAHGRDTIWIADAVPPVERDTLSIDIDEHNLLEVAKRVLRLHLVDFRRFVGPFAVALGERDAKTVEMESEMPFERFEGRFVKLGICGVTREDLYRLYEAVALDVNAKGERVLSKVTLRRVAEKLFVEPDVSGEPSSANAEDTTSRPKWTGFTLPSSVYPSRSKTTDLWRRTCLPGLQAVWSGRDAAIVAIGPSDSGKSHTIFGNTGLRRHFVSGDQTKVAKTTRDANDEGLLGMFVARLFALAEHESVATTRFAIGISCAEIYREHLIDLLSPRENALRVRRSPVVGSYVEGLSSHIAESHKDFTKLLREALQLRAVAASNRNVRRGTAHVLVIVRLYKVDSATERIVHASKAIFVDHASSDSVLENAERLVVDRSYDEEEGRNIDENSRSLTRILPPVDLSTASLLCGLAETSSSPMIAIRESALVRLLAPFFSPSESDSNDGARFFSLIANLNADTQDSRQALAIMRCVDSARRLSRIVTDRTRSNDDGDEKSKTLEMKTTNVRESVKNEIERFEKQLRESHNDDESSRNLAALVSQNRTLLARLNRTITQLREETLAAVDLRRVLMNYSGCDTELPTAAIDRTDDSSRRGTSSYNAYLLKRFDDPTLDGLLRYDIGSVACRAVRQVGSSDVRSHALLDMEGKSEKEKEKRNAVKDVNGGDDEEGDSDIHLCGVGITEHMCLFRRSDDGSRYFLDITEENSEVFLNGSRVLEKSSRLRDGDVVVLGHAHFFEVHVSRRAPSSSSSDSKHPSNGAVDHGTTKTPPPSSPIYPRQQMLYARMRERRHASVLRSAAQSFTQAESTSKRLEIFNRCSQRFEKGRDRRALTTLQDISEANAICKALKQSIVFDIEMLANLDLEASESGLSPTTAISSSSTVPMRRSPLEIMVVAKTRSDRPSRSASQMIFRCSRAHFALCVNRLRCLYEALEPKATVSVDDETTTTSLKSDEAAPIELPDGDLDGARDDVNDTLSDSLLVSRWWWWLPQSSASLPSLELSAKEISRRLQQCFRSIPSEAWISASRKMFANSRASKRAYVSRTNSRDGLIDPEDMTNTESHSIDKDKQIAALISENKRMVERLTDFEKKDAAEQKLREKKRKEKEREQALTSRDVQRHLQSVNRRFETVAQATLARFRRELALTVEAVVVSNGREDGVVWKTSSSVNDDEIEVAVAKEAGQRTSDVVRDKGHSPEIETLREKLVRNARSLERALKKRTKKGRTGGRMPMKLFWARVRKAVRLTKAEIQHLKGVLEDHTGIVDADAFLDMVRALS